MKKMNDVRAVLFDFDGTLADTAADLSRAINQLRAARGLDDFPLEKLRPFASAGARGMLQAALRILPDHPEFTSMRDEFLRHYADAICVDTRLFPGIELLLGEIEKARPALGYRDQQSRAVHQ